MGTGGPTGELITEVICWHPPTMFGMEYQTLPESMPKIAKCIVFFNESDGVGCRVQQGR